MTNTACITCASERRRVAPVEPINRVPIFEISIVGGRGKLPRLWGHADAQLDRDHDAMPYAIAAEPEGA